MVESNVAAFIKMSDNKILTSNTHKYDESTPYTEYHIYRFEDRIKNGYKEMGSENIKLAEEFLSAEAEDWPKWEDM